MDKVGPKGGGAELKGDKAEEQGRGQLGIWGLEIAAGAQLERVAN